MESPFIFVLGILFIVVGIPVISGTWLSYYKEKNKFNRERGNELDEEETKMLNDLHRGLERKDKRIEALEAELTALKTSNTPEPHHSTRDGFDRVPAFDVDGDGDVDVKDRTLEVMGVVLVLGLAAQLVLRRRARRRAD